MKLRRYLTGIYLILVTTPATNAELYPHQAGELLWEDEGVRVHHRHFLSTQEADLCQSLSRETMPNSTWHTLSVIFTGNEATKIDYGASYQDLLTRKIVPSLKDKCGYVNPNIKLFNFVSDVTIGRRMGKRKRVYRSAARWRAIQAIPDEERHARRLRLTDQPLSECTAKLSDGAWSIRNCGKFEDYGNRYPLESYTSIAGLIAQELGMTNLSEEQRQKLAVYEVRQSEERDRALDREHEMEEREREAAREREWNRDPCAEQPQTSEQGPSAFDVCAVVASQLAEAAMAGTLMGALWSALSDQEDRKHPTQLRLGTFSLLSCSPNDDSGHRFECSYSFGLKRWGESDLYSDVMEAMLTGLGRGREEFRLRNGQWQFVPQDRPSTPHDELPCCWIGDVRVRWGDCRDNC